MPSLVISIPGVTGLVKADLDFRLYEDAVATSATLSLTEIGGGSYSVSGLPEAVLGGPWLTLTYAYLGQYGYFTYRTGDGRAPVNLVLPVRDTGLTASDFNFALYKDGVTQADVIAAAEIGSPGDYRVSGWPVDERGNWLLVWSYQGITFNYAWEVLYVGATTYLQILSVQRPFPFGTDSNNPPRTMFSCNFEATSQGAVTDWEQEIVQILEDAGLADMTLPLWSGSSPGGGNVAIGPSAPFPTGDGPYIRVVDTGGSSPDKPHDNSVYENLSIQIVVHALDYVVGRTRALAIWRLLDGQYGISVTVA